MKKGTRIKKSTQPRKTRRIEPMKNSNNGVLMLLSCFGFICLVTWWLTENFGAHVAALAWGALVLVAIFAAGALFAASQARSVLNSFIESSAKDAITDRYRMQAQREALRGENYIIKADADKRRLEDRLQYEEQRKQIEQQENAAQYDFMEDEEEDATEWREV